MFNLRDLANVCQGLLRAKPDQFTAAVHLEKLWLHENVRVYSDRLICDSDRKELQDILTNTVKKKLGNDISVDDMYQTPLLFGDGLITLLNLAVFLKNFSVTSKTSS